MGSVSKATMQGNCQLRETVSSTPHLCPPVLPLRAVSQAHRAAQLFLRGKLPHSKAYLDIRPIYTLLFPLFLRER